MKNLFYKIDEKLVGLSLRLKKPFMQSKALGGSSTDEVQAVDKLGTYILAIAVISIVIVVAALAISKVSDITTKLGKAFDKLTGMIQPF